MPDQGYFGQDSAQTTTSESNTRAFAASQMMNLMSTATLCKCASITNKGDVKAIGTMSVTPLVNMLDGIGRSFKHGNVNNVIYCRMQGGKNAVILDPKVGDIGLVVFCDRDISAVKKSKAQANPGSGRRNDFADGVWVFTVIGDAPDNYIDFKDNGTIIGHVKVDSNSSFEFVLANDVAQIKYKSDNTQHVSVTKTGIVMSATPSIGPDPHPGD